MNVDDRIWRLVKRKLANEASEKELHELDILLMEHPEISQMVTLLLAWWNESDERVDKEEARRHFAKIMQRIQK